jgi:poly(beta-D-mannuronate) lyase
MKSKIVFVVSNLCALTIVVAMACPCLGADFIVANADDIETAMETAQPGDTLVMNDGTWTDAEIDFVGVGTADGPITLRPQTPGGVLLTGVSQMRISGSYLVVSGLHFKDGTIENSDHVVQFRGPLGEATHCRFTNSVIESYSGPDLNDKYHYVSLYGQNNRIDHNRFLDQQNIGPQIVAWLDESADPISAFHRIDSNHFGDRPRGWANGFETIRLGDSDTSGVDAHIVVENNLFERVDGEIEIISSKSNFNIFRYNTFRQSMGTLTLRHGNNNTVEGNFFLGENAVDSGGIRVVGQNHKIFNNYIADVDDEADGAISIAAGVANTPLNGYLQVTDCVIAHNTIVNVAGAGITFDWGIGSSNRSLLPADLTIEGNLILNSGDSSFEGAEGTGHAFASNIAFGATLGIPARAGILEVDPLLRPTPVAGVLSPTSGSPAIDGATGSALFSDDMYGRARIGLFDVGADEASTDPVVRLPLTTFNTGAAWFSYTPPALWPPATQLPPGEFLTVEAEGFSAITDPDDDGDVWTTVSVAGASGGQAIKAPGGSRTNLPGVHQTLAVYDLTFANQGDYRAYYLTRGFDGSSDSFYTPSDFGVDPDDTENISSGGSFAWESGGEFTIDASNVGAPVQLRLGRREGAVEIDAIIFHQNSSLTSGQLDAILESVDAGDVIKGDVNLDGAATFLDISPFIAVLAAEGFQAEADCDCDGDVDFLDVQPFIDILARL